MKIGDTVTTIAFKNNGNYSPEYYKRLIPYFDVTGQVTKISRSGAIQVHGLNWIAKAVTTENQIINNYEIF